MRTHDTTRIGRRAILKAGALVLATGPAGLVSADDSTDDKGPLRIGLITDLALCGQAARWLAALSRDAAQAGGSGRAFSEFFAGLHRRTGGLHRRGRQRREGTHLAEDDQRDVLRHLRRPALRSRQSLRRHAQEGRVPRSGWSGAVVLLVRPGRLSLRRARLLLSQ